MPSPKIPQVEGKSYWAKNISAYTRYPEHCQQDVHVWVAYFFESGQLAYWQCACCRLADRETSHLPERLVSVNGWIENPPLLIAQGTRPPFNTRSWATATGQVLREGDPSTTHFGGLEIPDIAEAHTYVFSNPSGQVIEIYKPFRQRLGLYSDHYWLTRYQVIGSKLLCYTSHCFEESTYDAPFTSKPDVQVLISDLTLLSP